MRVRALCFLALLIPLAVPAPARSADDKAKTPTVVIRVASLDNLIADARYLLTQAGREEEAKQGEAFLKAILGDKGLEGFDSKRPLGFYGHLGPNGIDSTGVLMLPVSDEKAVLDLLARQDIKPEKKDGLYSFTPEKSPVPIYFRFANKYVYVTGRDKEALDKDKLLAPGKVLAAKDVGTFSASFNFGGIPKEIRETVLGQVELRLNDLKERNHPGETAAQKELRSKAIDEIALTLKSLLEDSGSLTVRFAVDRKANDISFSLDLSARPGSKLAKNVQSLAETKSLVAGLIASTSAANGRLHVSVPGGMRKALGPAVDDAFNQILKSAKDEGGRQFLARYARTLLPTLKAGVLDFAIDIRGPSKNKLYTAVAGLRVKNGANIEKSMREVAKQILEKDPDLATLDVAKVGSISIHRLNKIKNLLKDADRRDFGNNPGYLAIRDDAVFFALGEDGLKALKEALAVQPKAGPVLRVEFALGRYPRVGEGPRRKFAEGAAREAFKGENKDADKIYLTLEGGKALRLRAGMKGPVLRFLSLVDQAEKKARDQ
jgi:hypothetical protein